MTRASLQLVEGIFLGRLGVVSAAILEVDPARNLNSFEDRICKSRLPEKPRR